MKFKKGDKIEYCGTTGKIVLIEDDFMEYLRDDGQGGGGRFCSDRGQRGWVVAIDSGEIKKLSTNLWKGKRR